jgi:hypothetical protein
MRADDEDRPARREWDSLSAAMVGPQAEDIELFGQIQSTMLDR